MVSPLNLYLNFSLKFKGKRYLFQQEKKVKNNKGNNRISEFAITVRAKLKHEFELQKSILLASNILKYMTCQEKSY